MTAINGVLRTAVLKGGLLAANRDILSFHDGVSFKAAWLWYKDIIKNNKKNIKTENQKKNELTHSNSNNT